jgi:hypothetical protein
MSLRTFHLAFILISILGADLFGLWAIWRHAQGGDGSLLALGIVALLGGLGLVFYVLKLVRKLDSAAIH